MMQKYEDSMHNQTALQLRNAENAALRMEVKQLKMEIGLRRQEQEDQELKIMVSGLCRALGSGFAETTCSDEVFRQDKQGG